MCHSFEKKFKEIFDKYAEEEEELEKQIKKCEKLRAELKTQYSFESKDLSSMDLKDIQAQRIKAKARNDKILEDLEKSRAILRTKSAYSPTDQELVDAAAVYRSYLEAPDDETKTN